jgi:hypothetical protein
MILRKAKVVLGEEAKQLLLSGKTLTIRIPGPHVAELELSLKSDLAADAERRQIADKFRAIGRKASVFGGLDLDGFDLPDFLKKK